MVVNLPNFFLDTDFFLQNSKKGFRGSLWSDFDKIIYNQMSMDFPGNKLILKINYPPHDRAKEPT